MNSRLVKLLALLAGVGVGAFATWCRRAHRRTPEATTQPGSSGTRVIVVEQPSIPSKRAGWKRWLLRLGGLGAVLAIGGLLIAASGIIPIKASSGHWPITRWFLQFSKSRSVATHTIGVRVPALDEPWMLVKGAGHYETGCAPCHGSPLRSQPRVAEHMLPRPPQLKQISSKRDPAELFYFVKHGIKLTGMPAWPAPHRDDEVWAMVAFLRRLPEIDAEEYRRLASGDVQLDQGAPIRDLQTPANMPGVVIESCARCHGVDGMGRGTGAFPKLAGQRPKYLLGSLQAYATGQRHSGVMGPIAAGLNPKTMHELATYYANLQPRSAPIEDAHSEAIERGRVIATHGVPDRQVPACIECHGPRAGPRNEHYPALAGQYADYLTLQLQLFKDEHRGGTAYAHIMRMVAERLTPEQMRDVARYYASLRPMKDDSAVALSSNATAGKPISP